MQPHLSKLLAALPKHFDKVAVSDAAATRSFKLVASLDQLAEEALTPQTCWSEDSTVQQ